MLVLYMYMCSCSFLSVDCQVAQKFDEKGILSKMATTEFVIFIIFSDAYTCFDVV